MVITNRIPAGDKGRARGAGLVKTIPRDKKGHFKIPLSKKAYKNGLCVKERAGFVVGNSLCLYSVYTLSIVLSIVKM